ncbi:ankyrin repeat domain-containing protein [Candidatus Berkiella cookevillensis]|uniref:Ankyrin repeat domain-containing protein n=1 Tax=Candidatus Berkiella cookevillensis TaxID=437022 RepID=A0A0Q9YTG9_9GAMM|nr:ankyrin repeat domain-containing protein [Candidatus Berkiella cookevillensis]MCS5708530.1 ankyrin repeat domain-containing protein [Candidatus Berkiella cookevillensis]
MIDKLKLLRAMQAKDSAIAIAEINSADIASAEINSADIASLNFYFKENSAASNEYTLLHYAVQCQLPEVVDALLKKGMDPEIKSLGERKHGAFLETPLHTAVRQLLYYISNEAEKISMLRIIEILLSQSPNTRLALNGDQATPIHLATYNEKALSALKLFFNPRFPGVDINLTNSYGSTLLHKAAVCNNAPALKFLLKMRANPRLYNHAGKLAIDSARKGTEIHNILKPYHETVRSLQTLCFYKLYQEKAQVVNIIPVTLARRFEEISLEIQSQEEARRRATLLS